MADEIIEELWRIKDDMAREYGNDVGKLVADLQGGKPMRKTLHIRTTVLPGGKVEFASPELEAGQTVDVVVTPSSSTERRSVVDILAETPGGLIFKTAEDVAAYMKEEKEAWDR